jgi:hypothetical protein
MTRAIVGVAIVCVCRAAFAASQPAQPPTPRETIPLTRFAAQATAFVEYSGVGDSLRTVVRDSVEWRRMWAQINAPFIPRPSLPPVDFQREMVVVAAMGRQPGGGYDIIIERATEDSSGIEVLIRRTIPGERCPTSAAVTQPVDLARIPASNKPVRFREREQATTCSGGRTQ